MRLVEIWLGFMDLDLFARHLEPLVFFPWPPHVIFRLCTLAKIKKKVVFVVLETKKRTFYTFFKSRTSALKDI